MIAQHLARKLLVFVLYSAAVTALPVLGSSQVAQVVRPLWQATPPATTEMPAANCPCVAPRETGACSVAQHERETPRWWCRGPLRRAVRGVACFIARPWRR